MLHLIFAAFVSTWPKLYQHKHTPDFDLKFKEQQQKSAFYDGSGGSSCSSLSCPVSEGPVMQAAVSSSC